MREKRPVVVIDHGDTTLFEINCAELLADGYTLRAVNTGVYDEDGNSYFQAVFVLPEVTRREDRLRIAESLLAGFAAGGYLEADDGPQLLEALDWASTLLELNEEQDS